MPSFELTDPIASHVQQLSTDNCSSWSPASSSDASATFWVSHTQKLAPFSSFPSNQVLYDKSCGLNLLKSVNMARQDHGSSSFEQSYRCYPVSFIDKAHLERGIKVCSSYHSCSIMLSISF
uniref:Uncharacterized protein n=1 Tax=Salix viminalis TaxID=40686 RepID=A0A6N2LRJ8_SALVM